MEEAKREEEKNLGAAKQMNEMHKMKRYLAEPENHRLWCSSPFSAFGALPTKVKIFEPVPSYANRFGELTTSYLEAVSL